MRAKPYCCPWHSYCPVPLAQGCAAHSVKNSCYLLSRVQRQMDMMDLRLHSCSFFLPVCSSYPSAVPCHGLSAYLAGPSVSVTHCQEGVHVCRLVLCSLSEQSPREAKDPVHRGRQVPNSYSVEINGDCRLLSTILALVLSDFPRPHQKPGRAELNRDILSTSLVPSQWNCPALGLLHLTWSWYFSQDNHCTSRLGPG